MSTAIHRQIETLRAGRDGTFVARAASGWIVLAHTQVLTGYSLLLPDPVVPHLNALRAEARALFFADMATLGDALLEVTGAIRINYALFGNLEPALHAHVFPRYADEPAALRTQQPWAHDWAQAPRFDAATHGPLIERLRAALKRHGMTP